MYPAGILLAHHIMALFATKKICAGDFLWKHSIVNIASGHTKEMVERAGDLDMTDPTMIASGLDRSTKMTNKSSSESSDSSDSNDPSDVKEFNESDKNVEIQA